MDASAVTASPAHVLAARQMMRRGHSMQDAALALGVIPSSELDKALWTHIATDDEDLVQDTPKHWRPDF